MFSHTKKVGSLGRYGPRVGRKLRYGALKIEVEAGKTKNCPSCSRGRLKRVGGGIWTCKTCMVTFTGGAHLPVIKRVVSEEEAKA
jgi:large subunit ribosomal protein L37Ae